MGEREHQLKTWPEPFLAARRGDKLFEFRYDDRAYQAGDILTCREWDPAQPNGLRYTRQWSRYRVTYVLHGGRFGVPTGFVVLGIRAISDGVDGTLGPPLLSAEECSK